MGNYVCSKCGVPYSYYNNKSLLNSEYSCRYHRNDMFGSCQDCGQISSGRNCKHDYRFVLCFN